MKKIALIVGICLVFVAGLSFTLNSKELVARNTSAESLPTNDLPNGIVKEHEIKSGETFAEIMAEQGVPYTEISSIIEAAKDVFDFTTVGAGKILKLVFVNEALAAVEYQLNSDTVIHVKKESDAFTAKEEDIPYEVQPVAASGQIEDSLFVAAQAVGVDDTVILEMADAFSWDIDFAADIRSGDQFSLVYEKRTLNGEPAPAGKLLAAKFTNDGVTRTVYAYKDTYYAEDGTSVMRQFLRSPLSYASITSGYSNYRVNPVTRKVETHYAIDYAAPAGTPILATAEGKVSYAATKGGLGITVEIKHGGTYLTQYAHLSKIAKGITNGALVKQGDVIGYVGSTGISTGPHLQYAMYKNDAKVNPLTEQFDRAESINESDRAGFEQTVQQYSPMIR